MNVYGAVHGARESPYGEVFGPLLSGLPPRKASASGKASGPQASGKEY